MDEINKDLDIPHYIFEEIVEYVEQTAKGRCRTMKWENIKALLGLARVNNRLTDTQVKHIINTYCRE